MLTNLLIIIVIAGLIFYFANKYLKSLDTVESDFEEEELVYDLAFFEDETKKFFAGKLKERYDDQNLSRAELKKKNHQKAQLRSDLKNARFGDFAAKRRIKNLIKDLLGQPKYGLEETIDKILPLTNPKKLKRVNDKFQIALYLYIRQYGEDGFDKMAEEFDIKRSFKDPSNGDVRQALTKDMMDTAYEYILKGQTSLGKIEFTFNDKLEILAQKIFEHIYGPGVIDMLREVGIDEIDVGVSGIPEGGLQKKVLANEVDLSDLPYSYESVWIVYKGLNIQLECLSFETQDELVRVCNNIYKYNASHVLSQEDAYILNTMIDGSRLVVCRPPFADSYCFFLRKFDSAPGVHPKELIREDNPAFVMCLMRWFLKGRRNTAITGDQGTGKSTFLKGVVRYIDTIFNIRLQEMQFELNLRRAYPKRNIVTFQETASISAQEGLNIQKKTNGAVNIVGEVATAIQTSHVVQSSKVASLFALWSHHGKTAEDTVNAMADNLLQIGLYKEKVDAVRAMANVINIDCHLVNVRGHRYVERITEIIPTENRAYPSRKYLSKKGLEEMGGMDIQGAIELEDKVEEYVKNNPNWKDLTYMDASSYFERVTDPEIFTTQDIIRWKATTEDGSKGKFVLVNMPSEALIADMKLKFNTLEIAEFEHDLEMIRAISNGEQPDGAEEWVQKQISY